MEKIIKQFQIKSEPGTIKPLKIGFINDSFIIESKEPNGEWYFLQKINHNVFEDVEGLQKNISIVTDHLRKKLAERGVTDLHKRVLQLVPTKDDKLFYQDKEGNYWRVYVFIKGTKSYNDITPELAYKAGLAFGDFQSMLSDLPLDDMIETIPNFHNMEFRLEEFREAVKNNVAGRLEKVQWMVDELENRADEMCIPERLHREGKLPKRINHCDTKVNNMLFDENDEPVCIVDLDTVMPGYVLSDFGDFMRTAANTGAEDDENLENISVDFDIYTAYTKGYLEMAKDFLTPTELGNLAFGAKLLSYMQTVRFFTDYLNGDTYYRITSPEHNWQRTLAQFQLLKEQEENYDKMQKIVFDCVE
ncbi:MAG: aminoglycoside phosphotransferase family protein [Bacteroidales bacterium]|nr:aminoglycoside phosphotransferase family protein [Bacteroidales bacterium]